MHDSCKFTIITICYNSEKTIERTIKSVLAQSFPDFEYIIVDGASKDSTLDVIKKYEPLFGGRMKWRSEPDTGIYNAMNKGIRMASGEIVGIVNSDDWLESDALEIVNACYNENGQAIDSIYCGWIKFHYHNGIVQVMRTNHKLLEKYAKKYEIGGIRHPATFVPKMVYKSCGLFDESIKIKADTDLLLRFYYAGIRFIYPNKILSNMSDGGVSNTDIKYACRDYSLILNKYGVRGGRYYYLYCNWVARRYLKSCIPIACLRLVRTIIRS